MPSIDEVKEKIKFYTETLYFPSHYKINKMKPDTLLR